MDMRGAITLMIISILLLTAAAKDDAEDKEKVMEEGDEASESKIRRTAVFAPQRLKNGRLPMRTEEQDQNESADKRDDGDMSTSQTQHAAVVQVQEIDDHQDHHRDEDHGPQSYKFGYEVKDQSHGHQFRHEQKDPQGAIHGRFGYRDKEGFYRQVDYVADDHGFRANVRTNEHGVENQNPADVDIQKYSDEMHHHQRAPPPPEHSEDSSQHYDKSEEEDEAVPHTDSSVHSDTSHEDDYDDHDDSHEETAHKSYQRVSETGQHQITLRPREKYSYVEQMQNQPMYYPSYQTEERHSKAQRRPSYHSEEHHAETDRHSSYKPDDYHTLNKGKAGTAIVSRHFYKKHLTHHQHVIRHPPMKSKKEYDSPKSLQYQQLSRGLSSTVVSDYPMKEQYGDDENAGRKIVSVNNHGETYRDSPRHYAQREHSDSHEKQQEGAYGQGTGHAPQKDYHTYQINSQEGSGEQYSSEEGGQYEHPKHLHGYPNNDHSGGQQDHSQEYIKEQNLQVHEHHPKTANYRLGPKDVEHDGNPQYSNDLRINKLHHVVLKLPIFGYNHQGVQSLSLNGNGKDHKAYVQPMTHVKSYGEHRSPSPHGGGKVHFPDELHSAYNAGKPSHIPSQYQEAYGIPNGQHHQEAYGISNGQHHQEAAKHHQKSPTSYQTIPLQEYHSTRTHDPHQKGEGHSFQYDHEEKQLPVYRNHHKDTVHKPAYNGNGGLKHHSLNLSPQYQHQGYEGHPKSHEALFHRGKAQQVHGDLHMQQVPVEYQQSQVQHVPVEYEQSVKHAPHDSKQTEQDVSVEYKQVQHLPDDYKQTRHPLAYKQTEVQHVPLDYKQTRVQRVPSSYKQTEVQLVPSSYKQTEVQHVPLDYKQTRLQHLPVEYKQTEVQHVPLDYKQTEVQHLPLDYKQTRLQHVPLDYKQTEVQHQHTPLDYKQTQGQQSRVDFHQTQVQQVPVEYQQTVKLDQAIYNQLINTASLSPSKLLAIPILKQIGNENSHKLFLLGASHSLKPQTGSNQDLRKAVEEVTVMVPSGPKHHSLYENGNNGKVFLPQTHAKGDAISYSQQAVGDSSSSEHLGKASLGASSRGEGKKLIFYSEQNGHHAKKSDDLYQIQLDSAEKSPLSSAGQALYDEYKSVSGSVGKVEPHVSTTSKSKWIPIPGPSRHHKLKNLHFKSGEYPTLPATPLYSTSLLNGHGNEKTHYDQKYSDQVANYGSPVGLSQYEGEQGLHGQIRYASSRKILFKKTCNCIVKDGKIIPLKRNT